MIISGETSIHELKSVTSGFSVDVKNEELAKFRASTSNPGYKSQKPSEVIGLDDNEFGKY